jgi:hypothetical protein
LIAQFSQSELNRECRAVQEVQVAGYALIVVDMIKDNVNTAQHGMME